MRFPANFLHRFCSVALALSIWLIGSQPLAGATTEGIFDILKSRQTRTQTIDELKSHRNSQDIRVRLTAAKLLLAIGDKEGATICQAVLNNTEMESEHRIRSASLLEEYGTRISFDILDQLYRKTGDSIIVKIMAMQGHPEATALIMNLQAKGKSGGSYFFLAYTDINGTAASRAAEAISHAHNDEFIALAIYHARIMHDDRYLREMLALMEQSEAASLGRQWAEGRFGIALSVRSELIRDHLRRRIKKMAPASATDALASLYAVQKDYAFVDSLIRSEIGKGKVTSFHERVFWRIAVRRSAQNKDLEDLLKHHMSPERKRIYLDAPDSWFVDDYWIGECISYRPLADRTP